MFKMSIVSRIQQFLRNDPRGTLWKHRVAIMFCIINAILLLSAIVFTTSGFGYFRTLETVDAKHILTNIDPRLGPVVMVLTATFMLTFPLFGFLGIAKKSRPTLLMYIMLMTLLVIAQFGLGIITIQGFDPSDEDYLKKNLDAMAYSGSNQSNMQLALFEPIQEILQCCGVHNSSSWTEYDERGRLPLSCCPEPLEILACFPNNSYQRSCLPLVIPYIQEYVEVSAKTLLGSSLLVVSAAICGYFMRNELKQS